VSPKSLFTGCVTLQPLVQHSWCISPRRARALQRQLAAAVIRNPTCDLRRIRWVLATDVSYARETDTCYGAAVIWDYRRQRELAAATARRRARFPYVPGLLSFREIPVLLAAIAKLDHRVDLMLAEGQGWAHPRGFGLACHLGVIYDLPAVGCAKTRLVGHHREPAAGRGGWTALHYRGLIVGSVLRTWTQVKPVYVSPGHRISLAQGRRVVLRLSDRYRLPEPLRRAHALANQVRRDQA